MGGLGLSIEGDLLTAAIPLRTNGVRKKSLSGPAGTFTVPGRKRWAAISNRSRVREAGLEISRRVIDLCRAMMGTHVEMFARVAERFSFETEAQAKNARRIDRLRDSSCHGD